MTDINTTYDVVVLGDRDTFANTAMLSERAAERGAVIAHTYAFAPGEGADHEDLTEIEAVVAALSRAIDTRSDIWLPFPVQDLMREQHFRRLSLVLQRHGRNLLMGPELLPCPVEGGYSAIDAALRAEVRAVDDLDHAALAAAGMRTLGAAIERALGGAVGEPDDPGQPESESDDDGARYYGTAEAAAFLGKSADWVSRGLRRRAFSYPDGSPVLPMPAGRQGRRRFTVAMVRAIAWSGYRAGSLSKHDLEEVLERLAYAW